MSSAAAVLGVRGVRRVMFIGISRRRSAKPECISALTARACAVGEAYPYSAWNNIMTQIGAALGERGKWPDARSQSVLLALRSISATCSRAASSRMAWV